MPSEEVRAPRRGFMTAAANAREVPAAGDGGEMLVLGHPGGLEGFFDEREVGADDVAAVGARHGIEFLE